MLAGVKIERRFQLAYARTFWKSVPGFTMKLSPAGDHEIALWLASLSNMLVLASVPIQD